MEMKLILYLGFIAVIFTVMESLLSSGRRKHNTGQLSHLTDDANRMIHSYNLVIREIEILFQKNEEQCMVFRNYQNMEILEEMYNSFDQACRKFTAYAEEAQDNIHCLDVEGLETDLYYLDDALMDLQIVRDYLDTLYHSAADCRGEEKNAGSRLDAAQKPVSYFSSCDDINTLNKRFRMLAKVMHPDSGCGDPETFRLIKQEYEMKKQEMEKK